MLSSSVAKPTASPAVQSAVKEAPTAKAISSTEETPLTSKEVEDGNDGNNDEIVQASGENDEPSSQ